VDRPATGQRIQDIERPHPRLLTYYVLSSFVLGPLFLVLLTPRFFRYHTLRYRFDEEGISARWGILFRKEIHLTYSRIQDIHIRSNFVERWLSLGRVEIQTASGSAGAELTVEGLLEFEQIRDFIYSKMRGHRDEVRPEGVAAVATMTPAADGDLNRLAATLREVTVELRAIRAALENRGD
jgi:putative membrane protein